MISKRNYFIILILLFMVFVMFMFVGVSSNILSDTSTNIRTEVNTKIGYEDSLTSDNLNLDTYTEGTPKISNLPQNQRRQAAILSGGAEDTAVGILLEWCVYHKYRYRVYNSLPEVDEISEYDVILFGDYKVTSVSSVLLYAYADLGKTMIFTRLPDYREVIAQEKLASFFGISTGVTGNILADGIKIFSGFMINKERIYSKGDFYGEEDDTSVNVPYYSLAAGYEVYAVGLLEDQEELGMKDEELPPLLWRTRIGNAFVFVVNSDIFSGISLLGVLNGFMAHESDCYVYPIINAQTISLVNYPYLSKENEESMQKLYSRSSEAVARDLLWPNIIQILKNYGSSYSFFMSPQLDYQDGIGPSDNFTEFYLREIRKLPGDMGLSLGQVSDTGLKEILSEDTIFLDSYLPKYEFTALYTADFDGGEVEDGLKRKLLKNISLCISDYREGDKLIDYIGGDILSVKFNMDGYRHETMDDLRMICVENALGICNEKVDIMRVIYPEGSKDEWNYLSLRWSKGDTYFNDYSKFDMVSVYEMEKRVRRFLALDFTYQYDGNNVDIYIDHFNDEAYFMLCINSRSIASVENGEAVEITDDSYLIKATEEKVHIRLIEENVLDKPNNGKRIPYNPSEIAAN
ncbi:MAG: putative rane protein [Herbinix sp.]|nr:putative rane protein [Herbinix sp.]